MKKIYFLLFTLISFASFGQVIVAEDFDYPDGSLVPNGGWANTSGTAGDFLVSSGEAVVQHGTPSEDVEISFSSVTGDIYAGFDFSVDDLGAPYSSAGTDFEYFAHMSFRAQLDIVPPTGGGDYSVGISSDANIAEAVWATDLTYGTTYRAIIRFNQDTGTAELWINPATSTDTSIIGTDDGATSVDSFDLRQSDSDENETIRVDDLMVGQTFNDVLTFTAQTDPEITIVSPTNGATLTPGTTSADLVWTTDNLIGGETVNITVNGSTSNGVTSPFPIATMDGGTYDVTVELVNGTVLDSDMISFSVGTITQAADITALRAGTIGENYELTGEAIISYIVTEGSRNQKYIQDGGAGILIDDTAGTLSTAFNIGDGITGLKGELSEFAGTLQFVPSENVASASSTGNTLTPIVVSASDLLTNGETYESRLITLNNVTFADTGTFTDNTNYNVADGSDVTICRVAFGDEDLIGTAIPTAASSITGLGGQFNSDYQIFPRYASDVAAVLSTNDFDANSFSLYPNPTSTGSVYISSTNSDVMRVQIFDILGKQVKNDTLTNNTLNVSNLKSGVYLVKITQNDASTTKKLVIK
ncbi:T9SS type A sorting domain-containing protein [Winogradskyella sp. R77965]|uniref:T9SS type A sorting domain-containing protein n=1 Tax=Winogradskyella sp. R77965 TaxID=3093872 RepID=UPI0037DD5DC8